MTARWVSVPVCADCCRPEEREKRHIEWVKEFCGIPCSSEVVKRDCVRCGWSTGVRLWVAAVTP